MQTLNRKLGLLLVIALVGSVLSLVSAGVASAAPACGGCGGGTGGGGGGGGGEGGSGPTNTSLQTIGTCGDVMDLTLAPSGDITVSITVPSADPTEVWNLTTVDQEYGAVTGGRVGDPITLSLPALTATPGVLGFSTTGDIPNNAGFTHEISYTATESSPEQQTCTNVANWTNPGSVPGPTPENPTGRPNSAPALTGVNVGHAGTNDVQLQLNQEMLATAEGIPGPDTFTVIIAGAARAVTAVSVVNDTPPGNAELDLTISGAALSAGQVMTVAYHEPASSTDPALQDMTNLKTLAFGPTSIPIS